MTAIVFLSFVEIISRRRRQIQLAHASGGVYAVVIAYHSPRTTDLGKFKSS